MHWNLVRLWPLGAILTAAACGPNSIKSKEASAKVDPSTVPVCAAPSRVMWSSDSLVVLCLPASFHETFPHVETKVVGSYHLWEESPQSTGGGSTSSVSILAEPARNDVSWPPTLSREPICDIEQCFDADWADSIRVDTFRVAGNRARVETGWIHRGGQPKLLAVWEVSPHGQKTPIFVSVHMQAKTMATLDTLRAMLHTVRVAQ